MKAVNTPTKYPLRLQSDKLADEAFQWIKENPNGAYLLQGFRKNEDLLGANTGYGALSTLIQEFHLPAWAEKKNLHLSFRFFQKHTSEILAMLGLYSLPYCYAGANGVRVLYHSKKIKEEPAKRLPETAGFVFDVCEFDSFSKEGKAMAAILKVRLMHAAARYYSKNIITDEVPVNQEDMIGTMLAFSLIVIRGLRKIGIAVSESEAEAYLHHWKVIGLLMGIEERHLPDNMRQASVIERQIRKREFKYSIEAKELTDVLIKYINEQSPSFSGIRPEDLMLYLLGPDVASCLWTRSTPNLSLTVVELSGRLRNAMKIFSHKNYPLIVNQLHKSLQKMKEGQ